MVELKLGPPYVCIGEGMRKINKVSFEVGSSSKGSSIQATNEFHLTRRPIK